jgi:xylulokinase
MTQSRTLLVGIDIGTGGCKVTVLDAAGGVIDAAVADITTRYPAPGFSEQDPEDWIRACRHALMMLATRARFRTAEVAAIALDASTHNAVLMDARGDVLRPAIMWTDQRSGAQARQLDAKAGVRILEVTLNSPHPTWTLPQLGWIAEREPQTFRRIARVAFTKDHVRSWLCGDWATDWIDASGSLLFDPRRRCWSEEMCDLIGLPVDTLPAVSAPTAVAGRLGAAAATELGWAAGIPVIVGTSDTAVEAYGAGAIAPGQGIVKLATAGNYNVTTDDPTPSRRYITYPHVVDGLWYKVLATNACASSLRWFRDVVGRLDGGSAQVGAVDAYARLDEEAAATPLGADGLIFQPYLLGERAPHWDPELRGSFVGLTHRHSIGHLFRAVLEGIALSLADCAHELASAGVAVSDLRVLGGGAESPLWRQIVCDVLGRPIGKPEHGDASFGAALLAGVGIGVFPDATTALERIARVETRETPDARRHALYAELFAIYRRTHAALVDIDHLLGRFAATVSA